MKRICLPALLGLVLAACAHAAPVMPGADAPAPAPARAQPAKLLTLPATLEMKVGHDAILDAQAAGDVHWVSLDGDGVDVLPYTGQTVLIHAVDSGTFRVLAYTALAGSSCHVIVAVHVAGAQPVPGPQPQPAPTPTPTPSPTPLPPTDPLVVKLQAAYGADGTAGKAVLIAGLAEVWHQAADNASDAKFATYGDLFAAAEAAAKAAGVNGKLMGVQSIVQAEIAANLPADSTKALDAAGRTFAKLELQKVGDGLASVNVK